VEPTAGVVAHAAIPSCRPLGAAAVNADTPKISRREFGVSYAARQALRRGRRAKKAPPSTSSDPVPGSGTPAPTTGPIAPVS
jgi:hypothetical protein